MIDFTLEERSELRSAIRALAVDLSTDNRTRAILRSAYAKLAAADRLPGELTVGRQTPPGPFTSIGEVAARVAGELRVADEHESDYTTGAVAALGDEHARVARRETPPVAGLTPKSPSRRIGISRGYHRIPARAAL